MTVTNPTPETQHSRSFHTSVSRAYASVPHAKLSVQYGYEPSNTLQSSPQTESVTSTNGHSLNKLMEDYKPINSQSVLSSLSSPVSDFVGADVAPGSGNSTCHDDSANPIDSELTAFKMQQLQHDVMQLETAIKDNLNEQKELNDRLFEQLAEVSKPEISKNKSSSSLLSLSSISNDQSAFRESEIKRIYSEKLKTLKKQLKALNEQLQTTRYVISKSTTSLPSTSTVTSHQQLPCDGSITSDYTNQMSAPFDVYHSHELAKRLPAHISDPNGDLCKTPARQSNTLPVKCIHDSKTTDDDTGYRKKSSSRPVGYSFFTPNDRKKHKKITKGHLTTSNLLYPPDSSSIFLPENVASSSSQPLRTGSLPSTNGLNPISCGGYDAGGRSMISGLSGIISTSKDDTCPSIDPSVAVNSNTGAFSWSDGGDNTLARIFEFLGVSPHQVFNNQNLTSIGNNNVPGVGSSGSSALSASGLGVLDKTKAGSKSHISGANVISPESLSTPHSSGIVIGSLSGGVAAGSIGHLGNSIMNISPYNLALAFAYLYRRQECQFASLTNQQSQIFQELRDELSVMHSETLSIQSTLNNLTTELEAIRRDATTKAELQNQKLTDASSRIERLDAIAEESRQALPHELAAIRNEFHDSLYSVEYQVTTKIRDLSDNITSINNKVSMIEKPHDQSNTLESHGTELDRVRRKVLHYLTDLCVSFFALVTMLLQVLIRCLNLGAVLTENRKLAVCFSMTLLASCLLVYTSDPIILWLREDDTITNPSTTTTTIHRRSQYWRNILIAILSFFRSFSREMS
ncbi:unnamed protein product [Schistosoma haematobium]|nr:unnamed protein product [Schistosoma haematobium]